MRGTWKQRIVALAVAIPTLAAGLVLSSTAAAAEPAVPDPVASYPLTVDANDTAGKQNGTVKGNVTFNGDEGAKLPGGTKNGASEYIQLPDGFADQFKNGNTVTISAWIKNATAKANTAALYFGEKPASNNMPTHYWLLNPNNPQGNYKSVITNATNAGAPYNTEVGNSTSSTAAQIGKWANYTTVIAAGSITSYLNGVQVAKADRSLKLSDFADTLQTYIGRSNYTGDPTWGGSIRDLRFYKDALTADQVKSVFADANTAPTKTVVAQQAADELSLGVSGTVTGDLTLPTTANYGGTVTWKSSNEQALSNDGKVGQVAEDTNVTLTATVTVNGQTATKAFALVVPAAITTAKAASERLLVDYQLTAGATLPAAVAGAPDVKIAWKSSDTALVKNDGTVVGATGGTAKAVDLTATVTLGDTKETKTFKGVQVMSKDAQTLASYTRDSSADGGIRVAGALHLALSQDGKTYEALNQNYGVAFAEAKWTVDETAKTAKWEIRDLTDPYLFRLKDGKYAYVAISTTDNGTRVDPGKILFSSSDDLVQWSGDQNDYVIDQQRTLTDDATAFDAGSLAAGYDTAAGNYRIGWSVNGMAKYVTTTDFTTFSAVKNGPAFAKTSPDLTGIANAVPSNTMAVDQATAAKLAEKLGRVTNTKVEQSNTLTVETGSSKDALLQQITGVGQDGKAVTLENGNFSKGLTAQATYSDGSTHDFRVSWNADDLAKVDTSKAGMYTVKGAINQQNFSDGAMMKWRADPNVVYWKGQYYFIATNEGADKNIYIRTSTTMEGLKDASAPVSDGAGGHYVPDQDHFLWGDKDSTGHDGYHWAPELHVINGKLYCFYAQMPKAGNDDTGVAYAGPNWMGPAAYVMELKDGGDPLKTADWTEHRVIKADSSHLSDKGLTIDMTYFEVNGQSYLAWSQGDEDLKGALANVSVAKVDKNEPWKVTSTPKRIAKCDYGWELGGVNEGPNVLVNGGKVYMVFSAQYVGTQYATGMMIADAQSDLSDPANWTKSNYPWMHNGVFPGQSGLGHNSYFTDPYGDIYNVYHFGGNGNRHASIVPVHFRTDGSPILDMKTSEELDQSKKEVTLTITVADKKSSTADLSSLTVAGQQIDTEKASSQDGVSLAVGDPDAVDEEQVSYTLADAAAAAVVTVKDHVVTVTVTARDGTTKTYAVKLVKQNDPNPEPGKDEGAKPTPEPTKPTPAKPAKPAESGLSATGAAVLGVGGVAALLAIVGVGLSVWRRRQA